MQIQIRNQVLPVCNRDFNTSGAMATVQFIMPAIPVHKNQVSNKILKKLLSFIFKINVQRPVGKTFEVWVPLASRLNKKAPLKTLCITISLHF